jgi:hypothetical protein
VITTITNSTLEFHPDNLLWFNRSPACYTEAFSWNNPMMC